MRSCTQTYVHCIIHNTQYTLESKCQGGMRLSRRQLSTFNFQLSNAEEGKRISKHRCCSRFAVRGFGFGILCLPHGPLAHCMLKNTCHVSRVRILSSVLPSTVQFQVTTYNSTYTYTIPIWRNTSDWFSTTVQVLPVAPIRRFDCTLIKEFLRRKFTTHTSYLVPVCLLV
jgi:hypothetical protein